VLPKLSRLSWQKTLAIAACIAIALGIYVYISAPRIPILGFHNIVNPQNPEIGAFPDPQSRQYDYMTGELREFLEYLISHNYWFLSARELDRYFIAKSAPIPRNRVGQRAIALTFDDSYKSYYANLVPLLEDLEREYARKVKVTLFINPGTMAKPDRPSTLYIDCQDLRSGFQKGYFDIQSHGWSHYDLTSLDSANLEKELSLAQEQLRGCLADLDSQQEVASYIAYPFGATDDRVVKYTAKYYASAYLYNSKNFRFCWAKDRYRIPRLSVNRKKSAERLIQMAKTSYQLKSNGSC